MQATDLNTVPRPQEDWLDGSVGFVVESDSGRIGRVVDVQRVADSRRPVALVVRTGVAGRRRLRIPVDDVAGVLTSSERIILNGSWARSTDEHAPQTPAPP